MCEPSDWCLGEVKWPVKKTPFVTLNTSYKKMFPFNYINWHYSNWNRLLYSTANDNSPEFSTFYVIFITSLSELSLVLQFSLYLHFTLMVCFESY